MNNSWFLWKVPMHFLCAKLNKYIVFLCVCAFIVKLEIFQGEWILSNFIAWNLMVFILLLNKSYLLVRKLWKGQCIWIIISNLNEKSFPDVRRVVDTCWRWSIPPWSLLLYLFLSSQNDPACPSVSTNGGNPFWNVLLPECPKHCWTPWMGKLHQAATLQVTNKATGLPLASTVGNLNQKENL